MDGLPGRRGLNIAYEAVDRHVARGDGGRTAFRLVAPSRAVRDVSYGELAQLSNRFANVLEGLGVAPGEAVFAFGGRILELYVAALGTWKARCVFCALFSSFGPEPLRTRLVKGRARVLVTTDVLYRRRVEPLRALLTDLDHVLVVGDATPGTDSFQGQMAAASDTYQIPPTAAEDPAVLHFTSGTTGQPKGAVHVHEAVVAHHATAESALTVGRDDVYWCTADPGWVTGISYGLIAPLTRGATAVINAGEFDAESWYRVLQDHRVTVWYSAPTAIRMLMRAGTRFARSFDLGALRLAASVGEPLAAEAVRWGEKAFGHTIRDTWWQTETGAIMIANLPSADARPGAMGVPLPGVDAHLVRRTADGGIALIEDGEAEGELALRAGWPSMFRAYIGEPERYARCFAGGFYLTGDLVRRDADGWFWFVGRSDDVIKTAGHLIGPFEVESTLLQHPAVAEAGVIGVPDATIGEQLKAFVCLNDGFTAGPALQRDLAAFARKNLGPAMAPRAFSFVASLPKTRSGKIMRRLLKARELGLPEGDLSTLEQPAGASDDDTPPRWPG
jgi:acetyl-CoA synthetase